MFAGLAITTMKKNKNWLYFSILTLVVAIIWVAVSAVSHFRKSTVPSDVEANIIPLDPTIDMDFMSRLQQKSTQ